ncbi:MAG: sortase domain-containing protein [Candidatus Limnocylindria bacterium]
MKRLSGWLLPLALATAGVALIILGQLDLDGEPARSLPPIATPSRSEVAQASPTPEPEGSETPSAGPTADPTAEPTPTPLPSSVVATQLEVPSVGVNVAVNQSLTEGTDDFPEDDAAYILRSSAQPGRNTNSYIFAHAVSHLFKPLWNVQIGAQVLVLMSDGSVLEYRVTEVRPNVPCPDPDPPNPQLNPPDPPLALQFATDCGEGAAWTRRTDYERLTLQTSQGFNRNWGELVIIAEPVR